MDPTKRAVFLDRDGTIIEDRDYLSDPSEVLLFPSAPKALMKLQEAGFHLFLVTNQSGVGRGYFTLEQMDTVHRHLNELLQEQGVEFRKIFAAPEAPDQPSRGRKPSPQFLFDARDEFGINLSESFMIGDKLVDLQCGWNAGVKASLLVRTGYGAQTEAELMTFKEKKIVVEDLAAAAEWIVLLAPKIVKGNNLY